MRKQSLKEALATPEIRRALGELVGKPTGGWPETRQARRAVFDALPAIENRTYSAADIIEAAFDCDGHHYVLREGV